MSLERLDPSKVRTSSLKDRVLKILKMVKNLIWNFSVLLIPQKTDNVFVKNLKERYTFCNNYIKSKIVLDIPCGMGWGSSLLEGYKELYGVDISKEAILKARKQYPKITFKQGRMQDIPLGANFLDVLICLEGIEHITFLEGQAFFKEGYRILRDNGIIIITTPLLQEGKYHSGNKYHVCEYKEEEFLHIVKSFNFSIVKKDYLVIPNSKVLRLVLKKD